VTRIQQPLADRHDPVDVHVHVLKARIEGGGRERWLNGKFGGIV